MITRQVRLLMSLLVTLGVTLATHVRAAEANVVEVKLSGWTYVCRLPDFCVLAQKYPAVVPHVHDRDVERASLFAAIGLRDSIIRIVGITLPVDVDQDRGVILYAENAEYRLPTRRCDQYACFAEIPLGKLESGETSTNLIPLFLAEKKLHYRFSQGGMIFNVEADLVGFRENYVIVTDYIVKRQIETGQREKRQASP